MASSTYNHEYFTVSFPVEYVAHVEIDRPEKMNAFKEPMWTNLRLVFERLSVDEQVRCVVLSGKGEKAFTAGLDVQDAAQTGLGSDTMTKSDPARTAFGLRDHILEYQACITAVSKCRKPVIAAMHGYAFGLAIDISTAADIRICASNTQFCVKETAIGLAADIGTLSRLPYAGVPLSWAKDVCLTSRIFNAAEALRVGFVSEVLESKAAVLGAAVAKAKMVASLSPVAVQGTKHLIDYSLGRGVDEGLAYTATWNMAMLQTEDLKKAMLSGLKKQKATFAKL